MAVLRQWVQRVLLAGLAVLVTAAGLEVVFRLTRWRGLQPPERQEHPIYHHRLRPNWTYPQTSPDFETSATTNSLGLRASTEYGPKPPGTTRILMLGDSFTFGVGVNDEETFCALLQRALNAGRDDGTTVEVVNAGIGSYSPILHYLALRDLYLPLQPDAVVLWFDFGDMQNDFFYEHNLRYDQHGRLVACHPFYVDGRHDWFAELREQSALLKYFHNKFIRTYQKIRLLGLGEYLNAKLKGQSAKAAIATLTSKGRRVEEPIRYDQLFMIRNREDLPEITAHWQRSARYLLMIRDLLGAQRIPFVLAAYPYGIHVGPDQWGQGRTAFGFEPGRTYDDPFAFDLLEEFAAQHGIPFLNTYEAFRVAGREERLFHDWDGHFTPAGHRLIASMLPSDPTFLSLMKALRDRPLARAPRRTEP